MIIISLTIHSSRCRLMAAMIRYLFIFFYCNDIQWRWPAFVNIQKIENELVIGFVINRLETYLAKHSARRISKMQSCWVSSLQKSSLSNVNETKALINLSSVLIGLYKLDLIIYRTKRASIILNRLFCVYLESYYNMLNSFIATWINENEKKKNKCFVIYSFGAAFPRFGWH